VLWVRIDRGGSHSGPDDLRFQSKFVTARQQSSPGRRVFPSAHENLPEVNYVTIYDISMTLSPRTVVWPGSRQLQAAVESSGLVLTTHLTLDSHTGTHVDAPRHFVPASTSIDALRLDRLVGPARVVEVEGDVINTQALRRARLAPGAMVLFKTANSAKDEELPFTGTYVALTQDAADYLVGLPAAVVGIDYLSVEPPGDVYVHLRLLEAGIPIIEGLRLAHVEPGDYYLVCLPLKLRDGDAAPARAILLPLGLAASCKHT